MGMISSVFVWALIVTVVSHGLGALWYGPLFGKQYGDAVGMKKDYSPSKNEMIRLLAIEFVAKFVFFLSFAYVVFASALTNGDGALSMHTIIAFSLAALMVQVSQITWSTHKPSLYWIMGLKLLIDIIVACGVWILIL
ncbi:MAG: DUF1761 domain-containing protein [Candidatus Peribacteria bacterium]|nr:MAG: DUF1761 domain-containing protein [Candidatus Peribacteria bacterium]